jgi:hypothetical protein
MLFFVILSGLLLLTRSCRISLDLPNQQVQLSGLSGLYPVLLLGSALWAVSVWYGEEPSRRHYHWSLPFDRKFHDLIRIGAGGAWLGAVLIVLVGIVVVLDLVSGGGEETGPLGSWHMATFLTGPLTVYFLCSLPALRSDHPVLWILAAPIALVTLWGILAAFGAGFAANAITALLIGPIGFLKAVSLPVAAEFTGGEITRSWIPAALFWLTVSILAILAASLRRVER